MANFSVLEFMRINIEPHRVVATRLFRYFFVGGAAALTEWALFALLLFQAGFHYLVAATVAFLFSTLVNYLLGLIVVFRGGRHARHTEVALVYVVSGIGLVINLLVLYLLIDLAQVHPMASKIIATGTAFLWNFTARHRWVFA